MRYSLNRSLTFLSQHTCLGSLMADLKWVLLCAVRDLYKSWAPVYFTPWILGDSGLFDCSLSLSLLPVIKHVTNKLRELIYILCAQNDDLSPQRNKHGLKTGDVWTLQPSLISARNSYSINLQQQLTFVCEMLQPHRLSDLSGFPLCKQAERKTAVETRSAAQSEFM